MKNPLLENHVNPIVAFTGDACGEIAGEIDPSSPTSSPSGATTSSKYDCPCSSAVSRSCFRVGSPAPIPHRKLLVV